MLLNNIQMTFQSQYRLIYDTLAMYVQVWTTVIPCAQLPAVAHKLMLKDPQTNLLGFEKEFQVIMVMFCLLSPVQCSSTVFQLDR